MSIKCPSCGGNVSDYDKLCSYCGSQNPDYHSLDQETTILMGEGMQAFKDAKYADAIRCFIKVTDLAPEIFDAHFYLAACHSALNRPDEAIKSMMQAQKLRSGSGPICFNLAILCRQVGRQEEAQKYLEQALLLVKTDKALPDPKDFEQRIKKELANYKKWKLF